MWLKYWREIAIFVLALSVVAVWVWQDRIIAHTQNERDQYKSALDFQNYALLKEASEYHDALSKLPIEIQKIERHYEVTYNTIDEWKGDTNATDCDNARAFLNHFNY